jgi:hypothetical protein
MDSDEIKITKKEEIGDLYQVSDKLYNMMNIKIAFLLFCVYIILNSDIFIEFSLSKMFCNIYDPVNDKVTNKAIIITGLCLSISYIVIDILDKKDII